MHKTAITFVVVTLLAVTGVVGVANAADTRIKDIAKVQGVRANQLIGYGLVVGLAGTGDSNKSGTQTSVSVANMLKSFGITVSEADLKSKNVAAVMVTAQLPPFLKPGDTIDTINVSSMGDAKSIAGGTLLQTPLKAANGQVYAVAQGAVTTGGFSVGSGGSSQQKNFPTAGIVSGGAIVEKDVPTQFSNNGVMYLALDQPDFTTASRISNAIASRFGSICLARDPGTIEIHVPPEYSNDVVGFVASLEDLPVTTDSIAKVVINERTGTIVMGNNVAIDEVAVAQGGLSVRISKDTTVSQPPPFSGGTTAATTNTQVDVKEQKNHLIVLPASSHVGDVVSALNSVGATPRDIITILQAIKAAGAMHADLQVI